MIRATSNKCVIFQESKNELKMFDFEVGTRKLGYEINECLKMNEKVTDGCQVYY